MAVARDDPAVRFCQHLCERSSPLRSFLPLPKHARLIMAVLLNFSNLPRPPSLLYNISLLKNRKAPTQLFVDLKAKLLRVIGPGRRIHRHMHHERISAAHRPHAHPGTHTLRYLFFNINSDPESQSSADVVLPHHSFRGHDFRTGSTERLCLPTSVAGFFSVFIGASDRGFKLSLSLPSPVSIDLVVTVAHMLPASVSMAVFQCATRGFTSFTAHHRQTNITSGQRPSDCGDPLWL